MSHLLQYTTDMLQYMSDLLQYMTDLLQLDHADRSVFIYINIYINIIEVNMVRVHEYLYACISAFTCISTDKYK